MKNSISRGGEILKKILGEYAYPLMISACFCILILISWMFNKISGDNTQIFWMSILPSAFVDVISLVVSTILITKIIEHKNIYREKTQLFAVIKTAHNNLLHSILSEYKRVIQHRHANYYYPIPKEQGLKFEDIAPYFRENIHPKFQQDILVLQKRFTKIKDGVAGEGCRDVEIQRLELMKNYQEAVDKKITNFLREYSTVLNTEYMRLLIEVKEKIKSNPLGIHAPFGDKQ